MPRPKASRELALLPVGSLLLRYSVPAVLGMLVMALYNVVDRLYIGRCVGPDGLAGFALTFPPMMVMLAFGLLFGVGTATRISIAMGQGKRRVAQCYLGQAVCVYLILSFVVYPVAALFLDPILYATGGTPTTIPIAKGYLQIVFYCAILQYLGFGLNHTIRAEGHPGKALVTMLVGAVGNVILDPFFIFDEVPLGFVTLPGLGLKVEGAAWATVISQGISSAWVLLHFLRPGAQIRLGLGYVRIYGKLIWKVIFVGLPPFSINLVGSAINALYNVLFRSHAENEETAKLAIATISIVMTVQMLIGMPVLGVAQGMQPILGFNYGAKNYARIRRTFNLAMFLGGAYIAVMTAVVLILREPIFALFCKEELAAALMDYGPVRMAIFFSFFFPVGYAIIVGHYFQSLGRGGVSLLMSLSRQCLILVPLMLILPVFLGPVGVWWAAPASDLLSSLVALLIHLAERRRMARLEADLLLR